MPTVAGSRHTAHLAKRFFGSLGWHAPPAADTSWAESHLLPGEVALWRSMPAPDRRHAVGVARQVVSCLGGEAGRPVIAAALLHDVGKVDAALGTVARAATTVVVGTLGRTRVRSWQGHPPGWRRRMGRYADHPRLGAECLARAGSDRLTVAWAADHHRSPEHWRAPHGVGAALHAADHD